MEDNRLNALQEEMKLLKGEVKQSLASVRDYLLNMELPSSDISAILKTLGDEGQKMNMNCSLEKPKDKPPQEVKEEAETEDENSDGDDLLDLEKAEKNADEKSPEDTPDDEPESTSEAAAEEETLDPEASAAKPGDELQDVMDESGEEGQPVQEGHPMSYDHTIAGPEISVPRVNMLANLISWVARANKEIGRDQLAAFLEVYGISGHLSPELKEVILHLSEIAQNEPDIAADADIWSQAILSLHGILTGSEAPLHPFTPAWNEEAKPPADEEIIEIDKTERPVKLKLVLPDGDGDSKEFCLNLMPEVEPSSRKK